MLDQIGGFDEDFFAYADDAELGLRARIAGWLCVYTPRAVVRHHRGATLGKDSGWRLQLIERNRILMVVKLFPWSLLVLNPFYYMVRLVAGALLAHGNHGDTAHFPGIGGKLTIAYSLAAGDLAAFRLIPRMLGKRAAIDRIRRLTPGEVRRLLLAHRLRLREVA
jgi:Glycosyltransferase like family 2